MIRQILTAAGFGLCLMGAAAYAEGAQAAASQAAASQADAAAATPKTQPKAPTAERMAAARKVMATGIADQFLDTEKMVDAILGRIRMREPDLDEKTVVVIRKIFIEELDASKDKMLQEFTVMYASHFSVDDLNALAEFYRSDAGQHLVAQSAEIGAESAQLVMPFVLRAMGRMHTELEKAQENAAPADGKTDGASPSGDDKK